MERTYQYALFSLSDWYTPNARTPHLTCQSWVCLQPKHVCAFQSRQSAHTNKSGKDTQFKCHYYPWCSQQWVMRLRCVCVPQGFIQRPVNFPAACCRYTFTHSLFRNFTALHIDGIHTNTHTLWSHQYSLSNIKVAWTTCRESLYPWKLLIWITVLKWKHKSDAWYWYCDQ